MVLSLPQDTKVTRPHPAQTPTTNFHPTFALLHRSYAPICTFALPLISLSCPPPPSSSSPVLVIAISPLWPCRRIMPWRLWSRRPIFRNSGRRRDWPERTSIASPKLGITRTSLRPRPSDLTAPSCIHCRPASIEGRIRPTSPRLTVCSASKPARSRSPVVCRSSPIVTTPTQPSG